MSERSWWDRHGYLVALGAFGALMALIGYIYMSGAASHQEQSRVITALANALQDEQNHLRDEGRKPITPAPSSIVKNPTVGIDDAAEAKVLESERVSDAATAHQALTAMCPLGYTLTAVVIPQVGNAVICILPKGK